MKQVNWASRINENAKHEGVCEDAEINALNTRTNADALLQLDDEALFGVIKKLACNSLRQILSGSVGPCVGSFGIPFDGLDVVTPKETHGAEYSCYGKRNSPRSPSPSYNIDGSSFKKTLAESVCASLSPRTLDDVTALYLKHATSPNELVHVHVQGAIVDVINYFCHRAQSHDDSDFVAPENLKESVAAATVVKSHTTESEGRIAIVDGHVLNNDSHVIHVDGTAPVDFPHQSDGHPNVAHNDGDTTLGDVFVLNNDGHIIHDGIAAGINVVHAADDSTPGYGNGCHASVGATEVVFNENVAVVSKELHGGNTIGNQKDTSSSDTLLLPSCGGYSSSTKASIAGTEIISSASPTLSNSAQLSLGGSLLKRKRISSPITSLNFEVVGSTVAGRTRSQRLSSSPVVEANEREPTIMDNPEAILRKNGKKRIATEMREIGQNLKTACNSIDIGVNNVSLANKSASFSYMVREDISSHKSGDLQPPYFTGASMASSTTDMSSLFGPWSSAGHIDVFIGYSSVSIPFIVVGCSSHLLVVTYILFCFIRRQSYLGLHSNRRTYIIFWRSEVQKQNESVLGLHRNRGHRLSFGERSKSNTDQIWICVYHSRERSLLTSKDNRNNSPQPMRVKEATTYDAAEPMGLFI